jgi:hypothetical protein
MHYFLALLGVVSVFAGTPAYAQDIYVKPQAPAAQPTPPQSGTADLGMTARPKAPPTAPAPVQQAEPQQMVPPPPQPVAQQPVYPTPQAAPSTDNSVTTQKLGNGVEIIHLADDRTPPPAGSGPNVFSLAIQPGGIGEKDRRMLASILGISGNEVTANCYFEYDVVIGTMDSTGDALSLRQATTARYNFNGRLQSIDVFPNIACRAIRQPLSGMIIQQNGYYKVGTDSVSCDAGGRSGNVGLSFRYAGDGRGECRFNN